MRTFIITVPALLGLANAANGQLVTNLTIGNPKALALANSVTADPVGIDSIHFNPAGLALIDNRQVNVKLVSGYLDMSWSIGNRCDTDNS